MYVVIVAGVVITLSLPLFSDGVFVGVAGIDIALKDLLLDLYSIDPSTGFAFILDIINDRTFAHRLLRHPSRVRVVVSSFLIFQILIT